MRQAVLVVDPKVSTVAGATRHGFFVVISIIDRLLRALWSHWSSLQIGHRERYSVERLLAFRDYYQRTSPTRVFVVCALALLPAFVVAILVEFIPLRPPTESWKANYAFWIRLYATSLPIAFGGVYQVKEVIQPGVISTSGIIATAVGSCTCYVALTIAVAAAWKFPIPFGYVLTIVPFIVFYVIFFVLSIGPRVLAKSPVLRNQISSQMFAIAAQGMLAIAYPAFGAIFNQLSGHNQTAFIFVLPFIKFSIKQFIAKVSTHLCEHVGPTVVLSVDVCNVLYVAICVQTATSPLTATLLIASDAFFVLLALRTIYCKTTVVPDRRVSSTVISSRSSYMQNLLAVIHDAYQIAGEGHSGSVRTRAPFPLPLSRESTKFMDELVRKQQKHSGDGSSLCPDASSGWVASRLTKALSLSSGLNYSRIVPSPTHGNMFARSGSDKYLTRGTNAQVVSPNSRRSSLKPSQSEPFSKEAVQSAQDLLQTLFHSEYVLMAEFVECSIPVLYAAYLAFLYHLPTAAYYPHTRSLTPEKFISTQRNIMLYAAVEFGSFIGMNLMLQRKFGFSPLYQLAFVFETQVRTIQSHLFVWVLCILQITLVHNGVDLEAPFK